MVTAVVTGAIGMAEGRSLRILLVEDHEDSAEVMMEMLRLTGEHSIALATGANDALQHLRGALYDLIVTDVELPDGSGLEMLDQARAEGLLATTATVVWSANGSLRQEARGRGAQFIHKPADPDQVVDTIRRVLVATTRRPAPESGVELRDSDDSR